MTEGAVVAMEGANQAKDRQGYYWQMAEAVAEYYAIDMESPVAKLAPEKLNLILYGTDGEQIPVDYSGRDGRKATFRTAFEGAIGNLERRYQETQSGYIRSKIQDDMPA